MSLRSKFSGAWLVVAALVVGAMLTPAVAVATGQLVQISSPSGRTAQVTKGNQLQVAEFGLDRVRTFQQFVNSTFTCDTFVSPTVNSALVIKQINVNVASLGTGGTPTVFFGLGTPSCNFGTLATARVTGLGLISIPLDPGIVVRPGQTLVMQGTSGVSAVAFEHGYEVPAAALNP